ncbi:MAG: hypothetical protein WDA17_04900 [Sphaerochaetaceae bacterium]
MGAEFKKKLSCYSTFSSFGTTQYCRILIAANSKASHVKQCATLLDPLTIILEGISQSFK